ncbi:MAG: metal ABC transporter permease [Anaerolineaceae bacterium]|nr:metal ABC transporter permease [Anaerolineaceae bacterium]
MIDQLLYALSFDFMRNALIAGVLVSIACGMIGTFVVIKRIVFISGGIAHTAYGGVGLAYFLGISPSLGASIFAFFSALIMGIIQRKTREREDTLIGVLWAIGMAFGILMLDLSKGYKADLMSYLFGSILAVPTADLYVMLGVDLLIILIISLFFTQFTAISFDETFSTVQNVNVTGFYLLLLSLVSLTVVMLMRIVGLIMVIALLTIPAAISSQYSKNIKLIMLFSILLGIIFTTSGLLLSFFFNLTSGASIILVSGVTYILSFAYNQFRHKRERIQTTHTHSLRS